MKYRNPVLKGSFPDPSIIRVKDTYYLVNSSFEYLPGVPIHSSKDLIHWEPVGHCLTRESQIDLRDCPCSGGIFAPTLRYHKGIYYMITTEIGRGTFIVTTPDMKQSWSDPLFLP
ncbi:MAG: xylosidase, partial [Lachnospiraceae bacterium]|nr:xylosidase [Lachnospiraceae bacterium]